MKKGLVFLVILVVLIGLTGCVRSKTTEQQVPAGDDAAAVTTPGEKGDVMEQLELFVTQTAVAATGGQTAPGDETSPGTDGTTPEAVVPTVEGQTVDATVAPEGQQVEATATPEAQPVEATATTEIQPTSAPLVVVPTATPGRPTSHTIQKGESVYCISRRYDVNPNEVLVLNNLGTGTIVAPGDVLKIPQTGNTFPGPRALHSHPDTYTVGYGETIYGVACFYGDVDPMAIAYANSLTAPYTLTAGQQLQIP